MQGDISTALSREIDAWAKDEDPEAGSETAHTSKRAGPSEQIFIVYGNLTSGCLPR